MKKVEKEKIMYEITEAMKDIVFDLVPNAATTGYNKAVKVLNYIQGSDDEPRFYSLNKQQVMKAARLRYLAAVSKL